MAKPKEPINPWYVALVIVGIVFFLTACGYGTMAFRAIAPGSVAPQSHRLMSFFDQYGEKLLGLELVLLATSTFGAMRLDHLRAGQLSADSSQLPPLAADDESGPWANDAGHDAHENMPTKSTSNEGDVPKTN